MNETVTQNRGKGFPSRGWLGGIYVTNRAMRDDAFGLVFCARGEVQHFENVCTELKLYV